MYSKDANVDLIAEMVKGSPNNELLQMKGRLMDAIALDPSHDTVGGMLDWMCEIDDELEWRWSFQPWVAE